MSRLICDMIAQSSSVMCSFFCSHLTIPKVEVVLAVGEQDVAQGCNTGGGHRGVGKGWMAPVRALHILIHPVPPFSPLAKPVAARPNASLHARLLDVAILLAVFLSVDNPEATCICVRNNDI